MMPDMLKLAKKQSFPEDFPKSRKFWETSRNDWILKFWVQNQVSLQKVSEKNTQYIEISQNKPNLGQIGILGFQGPKNSGGHQSYPKLSHICYRDHLCKKLSKKHPFCYSSFFTM